jgi:hypothetical protein
VAEGAVAVILTAPLGDSPEPLGFEIVHDGHGSDFRWGHLSSPVLSLYLTAHSCPAAGRV